MRINYSILLFSLVGWWTVYFAGAHPLFRAPLNRDAVLTSWNVTSETCRDNDPRERDERAKYSVIVVSYGGERYTNLFQDQKRLCAFSEDTILVKVANPMVRAPLESPSDFPPFFVGHPSGPYHHVRVLDFYATHGRQVCLSPLASIHVNNAFSACILTVVSTRVGHNSAEGERSSDAINAVVPLLWECTLNRLKRFCELGNWGYRMFLNLIHRHGDDDHHTAY